MSETKFDGGRAVARSLAAAGVTTAFTLHGGHLDPIYKQCHDYGIRLVDVRHESAAGHAAEAWARLSGTIGVCMVTAGPGFTNVLTSVANAYLNSTPVLYLVGASPLREEALNIMQGGFDQIAMAKPITKSALRITDATRIDDQIASAVTVALSGRPGPVLVELPIDVLVRYCPEPTEPRRPILVAPSAPRRAEVLETVRLLESAKCPVLILGGLAAQQASREQVNTFLQTTGIPVVSSNRALGLADTTAPEYAHLVDSLAVANAVGAGTPDAALMLGARYGMIMGGRSEAYLPASCQVIHVHADALETARLHPATISSAADCGEFLEAVTQAWTSPRDRRKQWRDTLASMPAAIDASHQPAVIDGRPHPHHAAKAIVENSPEDAIFVVDGGESTVWALNHTRTDTRGGVISFGELSCLGVGMGMSLGAALRYPDRPIVQIVGDGAVGFHLQEFDTFVRHGAPVVSVVMNNDVWAMSLHGQQLQYGENYSCVSRIPDVAYADAARALGCYAEDVTSLDEIGPAMKRAFASGLPSCINLMISAEVISDVTGAMLGDAADGEVMVPYYENIPAYQAGFVASNTPTN